CLRIESHEPRAATRRRAGQRTETEGERGRVDALDARAMIKIVCTSCQKPLSLDETKLPMKEVSFPCPACKAKLVVDRRKLEAPAATAAPAASQDPGVDDEQAFGTKALIVGADNPALRQAVK